MAFKHTACFVITVMIVCNVVLYPSIFSTLFRQWFGLNVNNSKDNHKAPAAGVSDMPPHMRQRGPGPAPGASRRRELDSRRSASDSAFFAGGKHGGGDAGRGRGLMGSILPVYAIGILVYFAYIMYKIFLKDKKPETPTEAAKPASFSEYQQQYEPTLERRKAEELQRSLSAELKGAKKSPPTKTVVPKPKGDNPEIDVAALQKRLEDTEKSMQRMMDMMNNMGIAMNQVTKHLCSDDKGQDDPGLQADDEVSEDGEHLADGGSYETLPVGHSVASKGDNSVANDGINKFSTKGVLPRAIEDKSNSACDDNVCLNKEEEEIVEYIGGDNEEDEMDTVRRRHVGGATDGDPEEECVQ